MRVIQYLAVSANGHITVGEDGTDWVTKVTLEDFAKLNKECGVVVMGRRTYEMFGTDFPQPGCLNIVVTHNQELLLKKLEGALFTDKNPQELVKLVEEMGYKNIFLVGGTSTDTAFLKAGLINEIWINVHPIIIGHGKYLYSEISEITIKNLKLLESSPFAEDQVLLKYKVL